MDDTLYALANTNAQIEAEVKAVAYYAKKHPGLETLSVFDIYKKARKKSDIENIWPPEFINGQLWYAEFLKTEGLYDKDLADKMTAVYWSTLLEKIELYYDLSFVLEKLTEKYQLGIITNGRRAFQEDRLKALGLHDLFKNKIVCSDDVGIDKPHPKIFEEGLKLMKAHKDETVMVGNSLADDIAGANKAGIKSIWLRRGRAFYKEPEDILEEPDAVIIDFFDLEEEIERLNSLK